MNEEIPKEEIETVNPESSKGSETVPEGSETISEIENQANETPSDTVNISDGVETSETSVLADLKEFFKDYTLETPEGILQVFTSFTYGEMMICFLLLVLVLLYAFKWIWEVLR